MSMERDKPPAVIWVFLRPALGRVSVHFSELLSKILERVGSEGAFQEPVKNGGIGYVFDRLADALGISTVPDLQRAQDGLL